MWRARALAVIPILIPCGVTAQRASPRCERIAAEVLYANAGRAVDAERRPARQDSIDAQSDQGWLQAPPSARAVALNGIACAVATLGTLTQMPTAEIWADPVIGRLAPQIRRGSTAGAAGAAPKLLPGKVFAVRIVVSSDSSTHRVFDATVRIDYDYVVPNLGDRSYSGMTATLVLRLQGGVTSWRVESFHASIPQ